MATVNHLPAGHHTVQPYLVVRDVARVIDFVQQVFGATLVYQLPSPAGGIAHAEVRIGDSIVMMGSPIEHSEFTKPMLCVYVDDVDEACKRAVTAGALTMTPVQDQFYGDRSGMVQDTEGIKWWISTHKEDLTPEEIQRRAQELYGNK